MGLRDSNDGSPTVDDVSALLKSAHMKILMALSLAAFSALDAAVLAEVVDDSTSDPQWRFLTITSPNASYIPFPPLGIRCV